jgi:hypothetical protein
MKALFYTFLSLQFWRILKDGMACIYMAILFKPIKAVKGRERLSKGVDIFSRKAYKDIGQSRY